MGSLWLCLLLVLSFISIGHSQNVEITIVGPSPPIHLNQHVRLTWVLRVKIPFYAHIVHCNLPGLYTKRWNLKVKKPTWTINRNATYNYMAEGSVISKELEDEDLGEYTCIHVAEFGPNIRATYVLNVTVVPLPAPNQEKNRGAAMSHGQVAAIVVPVLLLLIILILVIVLVVILILRKKRRVQKRTEVKMRPVISGRRSVVRSDAGNTLSGEIIYVQPFHEGEDPTDPSGLVIYNEVNVAASRTNVIHGSMDSVEYASLAWAQMNKDPDKKTCHVNPIMQEEELEQEDQAYQDYQTEPDRRISKENDTRPNEDLKEHSHLFRVKPIDPNEQIYENNEAYRESQLRQNDPLFDDNQENQTRPNEQTKEHTNLFRVKPIDPNEQIYENNEAYRESLLRQNDPIYDDNQENQMQENDQIYEDNQVYKENQAGQKGQICEENPMFEDEEYYEDQPVLEHPSNKGNQRDQVIYQNQDVQANQRGQDNQTYQEDQIYETYEKKQTDYEKESEL